MIEIRIHGRGGQGAVIASEVLASAFFKEGKFVQAFPAFGVERRGAPVTAFTRVESYTISIMIRKGIWEKIRFRDLDILSLMKFSQVVEEQYRLGFYKRIADTCLFILGIFADYAERDYRYPSSGRVRPHIRGRLRIGPEDYAKEGQKFYKLAAEHPSARDLHLEEIFWSLHRDFQKAQKPLNFISDHYLRMRRNLFFTDNY